MVYNLKMSKDYATGSRPWLKNRFSPSLIKPHTSSELHLSATSGMKWRCLLTQQAKNNDLNTQREGFFLSRNGSKSDRKKNVSFHFSKPYKFCAHRSVTMTIGIWLLDAASDKTKTRIINGTSMPQSSSHVPSDAATGGFDVVRPLLLFPTSMQLHCE